MGLPEGQGWPTCLHHSLAEDSSLQWEVYNRGVSGNTTWQALERFETDIAPLLPAYVLIQYGLNDASIPIERHLARCDAHPFAQNLREIVRLIRDGQGVPILMTNHIFRDESAQGNGHTYRENYLHYPLIIRKTAKETGTPLIDLEKLMTRNHVSLDQLLHQDGLHLSAKGNAIYASLVHAEFRQILHQS